MSRFQTAELDAGRITRYTLSDATASYADVIEMWCDDKGFRSDFNDQLANSPYQAFRFETPAVTTATLSQPFEFVLLNSPSLLHGPTDQETFRRYFSDQDEQGVVVFENLGADATLVVPTPQMDADAYGHLAAFVRRAPESQIDYLWQTAAKTLKAKIGDDPVWLSTAGGGVAWLHVRIDDRPKYYGYAPYRKPA